MGRRISRAGVEVVLIGSTAWRRSRARDGCSIRRGANAPLDLNAVHAGMAPCQPPTPVDPRSRRRRWTTFSASAHVWHGVCTSSTGCRSGAARPTYKAPVFWCCRRQGRAVSPRSSCRDAQGLSRRRRHFFAEPATTHCGRSTPCRPPHWCLSRPMSGGAVAEASQICYMPASAEGGAQRPFRFAAIAATVTLFPTGVRKKQASYHRRDRSGLPSQLQITPPSSILGGRRLAPGVCAAVVPENPPARSTISLRRLLRGAHDPRPRTRRSIEIGSARRGLDPSPARAITISTATSSALAAGHGNAHHRRVSAYAATARARPPVARHFVAPEPFEPVRASRFDSARTDSRVR